MREKWPSGLSDSIERRDFPADGRKKRSHTTASSSLSRLYTSWKPRLDMPTW